MISSALAPASSANAVSGVDGDFGIGISLFRASSGDAYARFDRADLETHLASLKPIGLNCLLERPCRRAPHCLAKLAPRYLMASHRLFSQCLCQLGRDIGFTDAALRPFVPLRVVFTSIAAHMHPVPRQQQQRQQQQQQQEHAQADVTHTEQHHHDDDELTSVEYGYRLTQPPGAYGHAPPVMTTLVVQQTPSGALHLVSRGSLAHVLAHCTARFDGSQVCCVFCGL